MLTNSGSLTESSNFQHQEFELYDVIRESDFEVTKAGSLKADPFSATRGLGHRLRSKIQRKPQTLRPGSFQVRILEDPVPQSNHPYYNHLERLKQGIKFLQRHSY